MSDRNKLQGSDIEGLNLPSVYVSKFQIAVLDNVARVVLGEQIISNGPINYHSAFLMTHADLEAMALMIHRLLDQARAAQEQFATGHSNVSRH